MNRRRLAQLFGGVGVVTALAMAAYWLIASHVHPFWHRAVYGIFLLVLGVAGGAGVWVLDRYPARAKVQFLAAGVIGLVIPGGLLASPFFIVAAVLGWSATENDQSHGVTSNN